MSKKSLSLFLICFILITGLTGCGGKETSSQQQLPSISYRESEIKVSGLQWVASMILDSQERLFLHEQANSNSKFVVLNKEGKVIKEIQCPSQAQAKDYVDGSVFTLDQSGKIMQLQQIDINEQSNDDQSKEFIKRLQIYNAEGKVEKTIELGRISGERAMDQHAANMVADAQGRLYILSYEEKIEMIDQAGKLLKTIAADKYRYMDLDTQGNLMVIGRSGSDYFLAKLNASGEAVWKQKISEVKTNTLAFKYNPYDGCSYLADFSGIKKYDGKGKYQGEILNYRSTSIFVSDSYINSLAFNNSGEIYINVGYNGGSPSGQQFSIFKYSPEKAAANPRKQTVVTVGTADPDSDTLEKAARLFEKKHPDIRVEIKDYAAGQLRRGDKRRYENYVKAMNTEILSGKGPDIISIQGLPYKKYIDKKVFVDLNELMKKDKQFKRQDYYNNILKACETKGKLYAMPISFSVPVIIADEAMLKKANVSIDDSKWDWSDFHSAAKKLTQDVNNDGKMEKYALPALDEGFLFDVMLASNYRTFVDEDKKQAHFNTNQFERFLKNYKDIKGIFSNPMIDRETMIFNGNRSSIAFLPTKYFSGDLTMEKCEMGSEAQVLAMPQGSDNGDRCFDAVLYGINRNSKLNKEAWDFLKFLTSTEQQFDLNLPGMSINRLAQDKMFKAKSEMKSSLMSYGSEKGTKTVQQEPITPAQIARTRQLIAALNHCNNMNPQIKTLIDTEAVAYLKGEKSAAQTAKALQNKITLNLNE